MKIVRAESAEWFLDATADYRAAEPVRTNVLGSVAASVLKDLRSYDAYWWWLVSSDEGDVVGAAFRTAPFGLQLGLMPLDAAEPLAIAVAREDDEFPWLVGDADLATHFLASYGRTGSPGSTRRFVPGIRSLLYELGDLVLPTVEGESRVATTDDIDLVAQWTREFQLFVGDAAHAPTDQDREFLLGRLRQRTMRLWCVEGEPVAMAGFATPVETPAGQITRIGPVFTPEDLRGRGYGAAVTAYLADELVRQGSRVMLYADADYPVSNRVYQKIGFRPLRQVVQYDLVPDP
jgi:RimJ/RimL family protein N-acetyltransferase